MQDALPFGDPRLAGSLPPSLPPSFSLPLLTLPPPQLLDYIYIKTDFLWDREAQRQLHRGKLRAVIANPPVRDTCSFLLQTICFHHKKGQRTTLMATAYSATVCSLKFDQRGSSFRYCQQVLSLTPAGQAWDSSEV